MSSGFDRLDRLAELGAALRGLRENLSRSLDRPTKSDKEVALLQGLPAADLVEYVKRQGDIFAPETLVYLLRNLCAPGLEPTREATARFLVGLPKGPRFIGGHCERIIRARAKGFGFELNDEIQEFRGACHQKMWEAIAAGADAEPFWEERFFRALRDVAIEVGRARARLRDSETSLVAISPDPEEPDAIPDGKDPESTILDRLTDQRFAQALRGLPKGPRLAAWLRWRKGLKVESVDRSEQTVATTLKISGSMVRRHLRTAKAALEQDPDVRDMLDVATGS